MRALLVIALTLLTGCGRACVSTAEGVGFKPKLDGTKLAGKIGPAAVTSNPAASAAWAAHPCNGVSGGITCFDAAYTAHMYQEQGWTGTPGTAADDDAEVVGQIAEPLHGFLAQSIADSRRPALGTDSVVSYWDFDGSDDGWEVNTSPNAMASFWTDGTGSITAVFDLDADTLTQQIVDSSQGTGASNGVSLRMDSDNAIRFQVQNTSGSGEVFDYDSTGDFTITAASGWVFVHVSADNASGVTVYSVPCSNDGTCTWASRSTGTSARQVAPGGGAGTDNIHIGVRAGAGTNFDFNGRLAFLLITDEAMNATQVEALASSWHSARSTDSLLDCSLGAASGYCNFLSHWYDGNDTSNLWQDITGRSTAVAFDTDPVGCAANKADPDGRFSRDACAPATGERPLYQDDGTGLTFDGTDDTLSFNNGQRGGGWSVFGVMRNDDHTNGSHWVTGADRFLCMTGDNYVGNTAGQAYMCCHPASGSCGDADLGSETGFNAMIQTRAAGAWTHAVRGGGATNAGSGTETSAGVAVAIGEQTIAGWQADGQFVEMGIVHATMSAEQQTAVINALVAKNSGLSL